MRQLQVCQSVGLGRTQEAAAEGSSTILAGVWKPGLANPTSSASPSVTTSGGQQVAEELRGALTWGRGSPTATAGKGRGRAQTLREGRDPGEGRAVEESAESGRVGATASRGSPAPPRRRCSRLQPGISLPTPPPGTRRWGTLLGADPCGDPGLESPRPGVQVPAAWHPAGRSDPASPLYSGALRISCKEQESGVGRGWRRWERQRREMGSWLSSARLLATSSDDKITFFENGNGNRGILPLYK